MGIASKYDQTALTDNSNAVHAAGWGAIQDAIKMFMGLRQQSKENDLAKEREERAKQEAIDTRLYRQSQIASSQAEMGQRAETLNMAKQASNRDLIKWTAENYQNEKISPDMNELINHTPGMASVREAQMSVPGRRMAGGMSGLPGGNGPSPTQMGPATSIPQSPTGDSVFRQTTSDRTRADESRRAIQEAQLEARLAQARQAQTNFVDNFELRQGNAAAQQAAAQARIDTSRTQADLAREKFEHSRDLADKKDKDATTAKQTQVDSFKSDIEDTIGIIDRLETHPGLGMATGKSSMLNFIPGTQGVDAQVLIDQLKSRLTLDKVAAMKTQSRTGATGMGVMSDKDLALLMSAVGGLDTRQGDVQFKTNLSVVKKYLRMMNPAAAPKRFVVEEEKP